MFSLDQDLTLPEEMLRAAGCQVVRAETIERQRARTERFATARRTLAGVEAVTMLGKSQVLAVPANDIPAQRAFVYRAFGLAA